MLTPSRTGTPEPAPSSEPRAPIPEHSGPRAAACAALIVLALPTLLAAQTTAFTGATVWDGTGAPARSGVTLLVEGERISAIGANVSIPESATVVPLDGKFVMPGLVNAHGHVSGAWATDVDADPEDRIRQDLLLYARYGITSVVSLGDDRPALEVAGSTTTMPGASRGVHARLRASGPVVTARNPAEARRTAEANVDGGAAWLKLRVDDNLGTSEPMPWPAVEAVLDVGRERGVPVATHLFYLEDARRLLDMGTGLVAHSVRDVEMDSGFLHTLERSGVCYVPTLTRELSTFVYEGRPGFFDDPFFQRHALAREVRRLEDPAVQEAFRAGPTADGYRDALEVARRNLILAHDAGIQVAFGTDSGPAARFPGYFEHLELWMMVDAGMSPADALRSATAVAAACGGLEEVGTLEPGRLADFLVLGDDPTRDIEATRSLERVFVGGREVEGVARPGAGQAGAGPAGAAVPPETSAYLGQERPGKVPLPFAPGIVSVGDRYEYGSVWSEDGTELYFGVLIDGRAEIHETRWDGTSWTSPGVVVSDAHHSANDPFPSPDGRRLYFISDRPAHDRETPGDEPTYDIWFVEREGTGWGAPQNVGPPVNSDQNEYYVSFGASGTLYFASDRNASRAGDFDLYRAHPHDAGFRDARRLHGDVNTGHYEADAFVSPDESYLVFSSARPGGRGRGDLYVSFRRDDGSWGPGRSLGDTINTEGHELCPFVTTDGKYLFYTSEGDIHWVGSDVIDVLR